MIDNYYKSKTLHIGELYFLLNTKFNNCNNNKSSLLLFFVFIQ